MQRRAIFSSKGLIEAINQETNDKQSNLFFEDMVNGAYYRCLGIAYDEDGDLIIRIKSVEDMYDGVHDLYTEV